MNSVKRICIVCEGFEECDYFRKLINIGVFHNEYKFELINAKSISNIFPRYQYRFNTNRDHAILIFCDTDKSPYSQYQLLLGKLEGLHGADVSEKVIIYANPCTMQIVLSHFGNIKLVSQSKNTNAPIIESLTGITGYDASEEQRQQLFSLVKRDNYSVMKETDCMYKVDYKILSSSNIGYFLKKFEAPDISWIQEINDLINI